MPVESSNENYWWFWSPSDRCHPGGLCVLVFYCLNYTTAERFFFFRLWLIMKRMPITMKGKVIAITTPILAPIVKWFLPWLSMKINGLAIRPVDAKIMPPISSHFQAIIRKAIRTNDGIICIKKAPSCCRMVSPGAKASVAKRLTNIIARIQIILGSQWNNLIDILIFVLRSGFGLLSWNLL